MSTHSRSFAIPAFSKVTAVLTGGMALAMVGGYFAFGALASDAHANMAAPVISAAGGADSEKTMTRRGLRSVAIVAETSFVPAQQAVLTPDGKEMTRRGLRPAPELAAAGASIWQASLAIDGAEITRRGLR